MDRRPTNPTTILVKARDLIARPYGWVKGDFQRERWHKGETIKCYCASGAIRKVASGDAEGFANPSEGPHAFLRQAIQEKVASGSIPDFNDDPATKKRDILAAFDRAIELSKAKK